MKRENWKRQTFWTLPVYTGDVSGVCSALYELGGMVVMHDPSGCNSTYNTHDEIRWMDMESLIFRIQMPFLWQTHLLWTS